VVRIRTPRNRRNFSRNPHNSPHHRGFCDRKILQKKFVQFLGRKTVHKRPLAEQRDCIKLDFCLGFYRFVQQLMLATI
ncbi:hypothetical protein, partial [Shewanella algae]|uniref:hypothetical protein n=1 Tax=Shewanella algae TaxID=38313 RepID=UPI001AB00E74